jgi:predicted porin
MSKFGLAAALAVSLCAAAPVSAADLGGNCCADLEERVAELEATVAKKGNRKVSLTLSGVVNKAVTAWDDETAIIDNGADESRFKLSGEATIRPGFSAVYALTVAQGRSGLKLGSLTGLGFGTDNDLYTEEAYVGFKRDGFGTVTVGLQGGATDDLVKPSVANTDAANKRLTLGQGLNYLLVSVVPGATLAVEIEPFNGRKADSVKYVSPTVAGFSASAAWVAADDSWDAALNYASGDLAGFKLIGAVGYAVDKADPIFGLLGADEVKRLTANAGARHLATGLFAQVSYGQLEVQDEQTDAYHVQAGIERRFSDALPGATTLYGEYAEWKDLDLSFYGVGLNQSLAANDKESLIDLYLVGRKYEAGDEDINTAMGGVRLKF